MDEVYHTLQQFHRNLETFNDNLRLAIDDLNKHHEKVNPHWHDDMRNEYDAKWLPLEEKIKQYVTADGINYTDILIHKVSIIQKYLHGY
jgi:hypothetical protein